MNDKGFLLIHHWPFLAAGIATITKAILCQLNKSRPRHEIIVRSRTIAVKIRFLRMDSHVPR